MLHKISIQYRIIFIALLIYALLFLPFYSLKIARFIFTPFSIDRPFIYYLRPHSNIYHLTADLVEKNAIKNPRLFLLLAYYKRAVDTLKTGEYYFDAHTTPIDCLEKVKAGTVLLHRFTIVEGWTAEQLLNTMAYHKQLTLIPKTEILAVLKAIWPDVTQLEGLFFAASYNYAHGTTAIQILKKASLLMKEKLLEAWKQRDENLPWKNYYEALIAASLVEKETAEPKERAKIAGVIIRRLKKNMPLQINASVIYGMKENYQGFLYTTDLKVDTPYNTYTRRGLPPSPIGIPSLASIIAVLHPDQGNTLYFVTKGDGSHQFSDTLEEHHKAVNNYRKYMRLKLLSKSP